MRKKQTGFSLVELMVAALIGLIGTIVIFQVFAVFESQKRATTSGGDAQSNLALSMHSVERDVRQAGFGINDPTFFGCSVNGWDESASGTAFTLPFVPVQITQGSATPDPVTGATPQPDTLTVMYGSSSIAHFAPSLNQNLGSATANYRVSNRHGFELGDVIVLAELRGSPQVPDCILAQVQDLPTSVGNTDSIVHASGTYDLGGQTTATRFNKAAGIGPNYNFGSTKVFNLGRNPVVNSYTVSNGQLLVQPFRGTASPTMDGIVQMQAQYGKDTDGDNIVDAYNDTPPTTPAEWTQVLTIRVALVARVGQYEKTDVSPATLNMWTGGPVWTLSADDRHYRYRILDTIIPIRNMIWRRSTS
ncbi:MAG: PilW family protein [Burkholderiales bacterium]